MRAWPTRSTDEERRSCARPLGLHISSTLGGRVAPLARAAEQALHRQCATTSAAAPLRPRFQRCPWSAGSATSRTVMDTASSASSCSEWRGGGGDRLRGARRARSSPRAAAALALRRASRQRAARPAIPTYYDIMQVGSEEADAAFRRMFTERFFLPRGSPDQMESFDDLRRDTTTAEIATSSGACGSRSTCARSARAAATLVVHARDNRIVPFEEGRLLAARFRTRASCRSKAPTVSCSRTARPGPPSSPPSTTSWGLQQGRGG